MKRLMIWIVFPVLLSACGGQQPKSAGHDEGTVTYRVTYPDSAAYGMKAGLFPKEITLVFKGDKATFIASGGMGMIQIVNLMDAGKRQAVSLLIDQLRGNIGWRLTPEDIAANENEAHYRFESTGEAKTVAGRSGTVIRVRDTLGNALFEMVEDDAVRFPYWNSPFRGIDRLLLEYTHTINGMTMQLTATKVDLETAVDTTLFGIKGEYQWTTSRNFFGHLSAL
jgi:hypothetical protein